MNRSNMYLLIIVIVFLSTNNIHSQNVNDIDNAIKSLFGKNYYLNTVDGIDSLHPFSNVGIGFPMNDAYGTLRESYIFIALKEKDVNNEETVGIVGIYKNNKIIWSSGPTVLVDFLSNASILAVLDLNKNGKIDIVTIWYKYISSTIYNLWIYSWDGSEGKLITKLKNNGQSALDGEDVPILLDRNGDGILEICDSILCYSWNGSKYGKWDDDPFPEIVPKNKLNANVGCRVLNTLSSYEYEYKLSNNINSIQKIEQFRIDAASDNISNFNGPKGWVSYYKKNEKFIIFEFSINNSITEDLKAFIKPGEAKGVYSFISSDLPKIKSIYLQGYNYKKDFNIEKIKSNSIIIKTLSPNDIFDPFIPIEFIDTLITYLDSSYALGWIKNEQTRDKYDNYFNNTKNYLNQNNNNAAKSELQKVLTDCNADSSTVLSSEAYALLFFNSDYLIKQIPEGKPGLPVKLEDNQGKLLQGGSLQ